MGGSQNADITGIAFPRCFPLKNYLQTAYSINGSIKTTYKPIPASPVKTALSFLEESSQRFSFRANFQRAALPKE